MAYATSEFHYVFDGSGLQQKHDLASEYWNSNALRSAFEMHRGFASPDVQTLQSKDWPSRKSERMVVQKSSSEGRVSPKIRFSKHVAGHRSVNDDTVVQSYESAIERRSSDAFSPRILSPIERPPSIPAPKYIPPPPIRPQQFSFESHHHVSKIASSSEIPTVQELALTQESNGPAQVSAPRSDHEHSDAPTMYDFEFEKIESFRIECWSLRSRVRELRLTLKEKEQIKVLADDRLMQKMTMEVLGLSLKNLTQKDGKSVADLLDDCRSARGDYGPLEDDYITLEDQLSRQEFELTKMEKEFSLRWKQPPEIVSPEVATSRQSSLASSTMVDVEEIPSEHPLVTHFESRLGDLDILQERIVELEQEMEVLMDVKESRERLEKILGPEDQARLDTLQESLHKLYEEARLTQMDVNLLNLRCVSEGLVDEDGEPTDFQSRERSTFPGDDDMKSDDRKSVYVKHPTLLPEPGTKQALLNNSPLEPQNQSGSVSGMINQWMLRRLRDSALEVSLLERTFQIHHGDIDERWDRDVLKVWWNDGIAEGYRIYASTATTKNSSNVEALLEVVYNSQKAE